MAHLATSRRPPTSGEQRPLAAGRFPVEDSKGGVGPDIPCRNRPDTSVIPIRIRNPVSVWRRACADKRLVEVGCALTTAIMRMRFPNRERTIPIVSRDGSIGTPFFIAVVLDVSDHAVFLPTGTTVSAASADEPSRITPPVHMSPCAQGASKEGGLVEHPRGKSSVLPRCP